MDLYFSPLACSMATRIAFYEAGQPTNYLRVDTKASPKRVEDGTLFATINGMGQVPVLRTDDGELIRENPVILQYVAERFPEAKLAPTDPAGRRKLQTWLSFIGSELHTGVFIALLRPDAPDSSRPSPARKPPSASRTWTPTWPSRTICWTPTASPTPICS